MTIAAGFYNTLNVKRRSARYSCRMFKWLQDKRTNAQVILGDFTVQIGKVDKIKDQVKISQ